MLISVAVTIALTRRGTPVLGLGFFCRTGSRGSKKLLLASSQTQAFSHGWRSEAYEPQLNAAEVYDAGTALLVA